MMWQRWVRRSSSPVVILASPKTVVHSLKLRISREDDAGKLIELAQQMEKQSAAGGTERQVSKFVEDYEIDAGKGLGQLAGLAVGLLLLERVDEFDG